MEKQPIQRTRAFLEWSQVRFFYVGTIEPQLNADGNVEAFAPQALYSKKGTVALNKYGTGPFCRFRVSGLPNSSGVYIYVIDDEPIYVGRAQDLNARFYGYGLISPKNCYIGGQETNCRINTLVYEACVEGRTIDIYVHETPEYVTLEAQMIAALRPRWNRSGATTTSTLSNSAAKQARHAMPVAGPVVSRGSRTSLPERYTWRSAVLNIIEGLPTTFRFSDVYREAELRLQDRFPSNNSIPQSVAVTLQQLVRSGVVEKLDRGLYCLCKPTSRSFSRGDDSNNG